MGEAFACQQLLDVRLGGGEQLGGLVESELRGQGVGFGGGAGEQLAQGGVGLARVAERRGGRAASARDPGGMTSPLSTRWACATAATVTTSARGMPVREVPRAKSSFRSGERRRVRRAVLLVVMTAPHQAWVWVRGPRASGRVSYPRLEHRRWSGRGGARG